MSENANRFMDIDAARLNELLTVVDRTTVVKIHASFCAPCRAMAPRLDELAAQHPEVQFFALQADVDPATLTAMKALGVTSVPTIICIQPDGQQVRHTGAQADRALGEWLKNL